jgi:hypothetical protein
MGNSFSGTPLPASAQKAKSPLAGSLSPFAASFSVRSESLAQVREREGGRERERERARAREREGREREREGEREREKESPWYV